MTGPSGAVGSSVVATMAAAGHEVTPIARRGGHGWDLAGPMSTETQQVVRSVDVVVHCAADIRIGGPSGTRDATNVGAVEHLVAVLEGAPSPPRLVQISSAFAAERDRGHNNAYEQSKWAAEQIVQASSLDSVIVRPSLVIGHSATGEIGRFSGIFAFLRMLSLGLVPAIPGYTGTTVDLVPIDIVTDLLLAELEAPSETKAILLATTGSASPTLEQLIATVFDALEEHRGERVDRPKFVKPQVYHRLFRPLVEPELSPAQLVLLETIEVFLPYFEFDHVFESRCELGSAQVLHAWQVSVQNWIDVDGGAGSSRGRSVWARRS